MYFYNFCFELYLKSIFAQVDSKPVNEQPALVTMLTGALGEDAPLCLGHEGHSSPWHPHPGRSSAAPAWHSDARQSGHAIASVCAGALFPTRFMLRVSAIELKQIRSQFLCPNKDSLAQTTSPHLERKLYRTCLVSADTGDLGQTGNTGGQGTSPPPGEGQPCQSE